jgi:Zn-dependent protease with chaperone function
MSAWLALALGAAGLAAADGPCGTGAPACAAGRDAAPASVDYAARTRRLYDALVRGSNIARPARFVYDGGRSTVDWDCDAGGVVAGGDPIASALCVGGGDYAAVYAGSALWDLAGDCSASSERLVGVHVRPEDGVAVALAHEIAHVARRHAAALPAWIERTCARQAPSGWPRARPWTGDWLAYLESLGPESRRQARRYREAVAAEPEAARAEAGRQANEAVCLELNAERFAAFQRGQELEADETALAMLCTLRVNGALQVDPRAGVCMIHAIADWEGALRQDALEPELRSHPRPIERAEIARRWARDCPGPGGRP